MTARHNLASASVWRIAIDVPEGAAPLFEAALADVTDAVSTRLPPVGAGPGASARIEGYASGEPDRAALTAALALAEASSGIAAPVPQVELLPPTNWAAVSQHGMKPVQAGRFTVHDAAHRDAVPAAGVGIEVEAGLAFGSGHHETTRGCLLAIDALARRRRFMRPLDMGCGSGVLALAMAKLWRCPVLAVDNDPVAVRVTRENARLNAVAGWLRAAVGVGYSGVQVGRRKPYDLVVANILARPLCAMASDLAVMLAPGGRAVLSGLLTEQETAVLSAHRMAGLALERRWRLGGWSTLLLRR